MALHTVRRVELDHFKFGRVRAVRFAWAMASFALNIGQFWGLIEILESPGYSMACCVATDTGRVKFPPYLL